MRERAEPVHECHECAELLEWAAAYLDGEASAELRSELMVHVHDCAVCARMLRSLQRMVEVFHLIPHQEVPAHVHEQLWIAIRHELDSVRDEDEEA
uniref:Putative zinc-finger domain-containing protein n=1 Tax=candidate division WOR-3 bacterium TaxID=2052148 RepID=A0A7C4GH76_UNCW3